MKLTGPFSASITISLPLLATLFLWHAVIINGENCNPDQFVYGGNDIVDQLVICTIGKAFDLDLVPKEDHVSSTIKALVEQGFSNMTNTFYAKMNGLWTARRAKFVETGWKCMSNKTIANSIIQIDGLSLDVIEKVDIPLSRNQQKLNLHKPCKTFDLPPWLCRQSKQLYRTTRTWVNSAFFNLTLSQATTGLAKASIESLSLLFTCPETFKQKITHSPSAMYILAKYIQDMEPSQSYGYAGDPTESHRSKNHERRAADEANQSDKEDADTYITHPVSFVSAQDGKGLTAPSYYSSVNFIRKQASELLSSSLNECILQIEPELNLSADRTDFSTSRYKADLDSREAEGNAQTKAKKVGLECTNSNWLSTKMESAHVDNNLNEDDAHQLTKDDNHEKRSRKLLRYPSDPSETLDPFAYYYENSDSNWPDEGLPA